MASNQHIERLRRIIPQPLRNGNASYFEDAQAIGAHDAIDRLEEQLETLRAAASTPLNPMGGDGIDRCRICYAELPTHHAWCALDRGQS